MRPRQFWLDYDPDRGGDHEVVSLGSGSSDTRSLHAAANHDHDDDEHRNDHPSSTAGPAGAGVCFWAA